ncbi:MAG TPA: DUF1361 domain-containing protein [Verrucomicrobiae bacterium]|nr:DUF1361 domain-containing protein [Verrucomicrobiae bacterium]
MNDRRSLSSPIPAVPLMALLLVSFAGAALTACRIRWSHDWDYLYLPWNLFLAWLPLLFASVAHRHHQRGGWRSWKFFSFASLWLLFFPNAPYIFTDLIHVRSRFGGAFWADLCLVLLFAFTGFLVGFISLYLMQSIVAERLGRAASWLFIVATAAASGFGIYLGRVLRWNSWDVVVHPIGLCYSIGRLAAHPRANPAFVLFPALFATFVLLGYLMLYALTHLPVLRSQKIEP